jgi:hypothetical protein
MSEESKFDYFMELADTYAIEHPDSEHFFNYFQWVNIDILIDILEKAKGRLIQVKFEYPRAGQVVFKGFSYIETVSA